MYGPKKRKKQGVKGGRGTTNMASSVSNDSTSSTLDAAAVEQFHIARDARIRQLQHRRDKPQAARNETIQACAEDSDADSDAFEHPGDGSAYFEDIMPADENMTDVELKLLASTCGVKEVS